MMMAACYLLLVWTASFFLASGFANDDICDYSNRNLTAIPLDLPLNTTKLILSYNKIDIYPNSTGVLNKYTNLSELYLNHNNISDLPGHMFHKLSKLKVLNIANNIISRIEPKAFEGLGSLQDLDLCHNQINYLHPEVFANLSSLKNLTLRGNKLRTLKEGTLNLFRLTSINLQDNPWNCTCKLLSLQKRVKDTNVTLANYNKTTCESPTELKGQCILTVLINGTQCSAGSTTTKAPQFLTIQSKGSIARDSSSVTNETKTKEQDSQPIGSSWHFLLGVIVAALSTATLIVCAVKCPTWYKMFFSYQHQQLQEEDLDTLENMGKFTDDEDGFIEDRYIDSVECNDNREN
ncbi:leucine-rich repeat-containing protein 19-like [Acipenser ruthenus]|uniref:leucine-rich repeat-containing protein 19-like n=1 Tax=Acipenser ruthenus TaxID=7906 RepID=UPI002740ECF8|nr:leucine-rich repeat-containing protein 19-like [Acipenser ruthenus]